MTSVLSTAQARFKTTAAPTAEETFGPLVPLFRFSSENEGVRTGYR
jgi:hypothetical protein